MLATLVATEVTEDEIKVLDAILGVITAAAVLIEEDAAGLEVQDADGDTVEEGTTDDLMVEDIGTLVEIAAIEEELAITVAGTVNEELETVEPEELAWKNLPDNCSATPSATNF